MKTLFLFTLTVVLSLNLNARENPFSMNDVFEEETGKMIEPNDKPMTPEDYQEAQYIKQMQQKMSNANKNSVTTHSTTEVKKPVDKTYSKQVDSLLQKTKKQTEQKAKEIVKKELKAAEPEQIVYVKPRADVEDTMVSKEILPFLKLEYSDNKLVINTQYPVSKKFNIIKENKIVIDYKGSVNFNTKTENIDSKSFKKVAVGNHRSEGFFRIAIELPNKPTNYDVSYKDSLITISKLN